MSTMAASIRLLLGAGLVVLSGCATEAPLSLETTDGGFLVATGSGGDQTGTAGAQGSGGAPAGNGGSTVVPSGTGGSTATGGSSYGGSGASGGQPASGGGTTGSGGACTGFFCPLPPAGGTSGGGTSGGGAAGAAGAGTCDNAICWDVFDCFIFHPDMAACGFTKCEAFVCKK